MPWLAGGLALAGAVIADAQSAQPLFGAAVLRLSFLDLLSTMRDPHLPLTQVKAASPDSLAASEGHQPYEPC